MNNYDLLLLVNNELKEGKSLVNIGKEIGIDESAIRKRLNRIGYKRQGKEFVKADDIANVVENITPKKEVVKLNKKPKLKENDKFESFEISLNNMEKLLNVLISNTSSNNSNYNNDITKVIKDMDKFNLLLENLDSLLKLIPTQNTNTDVKSNQKVITTLRLDSGIYGAIKQRAKDNDINITDIVDKALLEYLDNYL